MTNPEHVAEAYLRVAQINHYLIGVRPEFTVSELDAAEQILIELENDRADSADAATVTLSLALDIMARDREVMLHSAQVAEEAEELPENNPS